MNSVKIVTCVCVGLLAAMTPQAKADAWDQKTVFTFSAPVEVPGQVLAPGTYVFKIAESLDNRNVVEVFSNNQQHLYGMFDTIPDYHLAAASRAIITFEERAAGSPPAVKTWFYPGDNYGHEFLYKKAEMVTSAAMPAAAAPVATVATESAVPAPAPAAQAEESTLEPAQQPAEIAQNTPPPAEAAPPAPPPAPQSLPQTGSEMPLIGLMGVLSLAGAGLLRRVAHSSVS